MVTVVIISSTAILVAILGCIVIWGLDAQRAAEVEAVPPQSPPRLDSGQATTQPPDALSGS